MSEATLLNGHYSNCRPISDDTDIDVNYCNKCHATSKDSVTRSDTHYC